MISQSFKRELVSHLVKHNNWQQVLVFTRTKHGANRLAEKLVKDGIEAAAIHGNKSQGARTKALAQFKDGTVRVLVEGQKRARLTALAEQDDMLLADVEEWEARQFKDPDDNAA